MSTLPPLDQLLLPQMRELHGGPMDGDHRLCGRWRLCFESSVRGHVNVYNLDLYHDWYEWEGIRPRRDNDVVFELEPGERT